MPPRSEPVPLRTESQRLGCTCNWWRENMIIEFDPGCPLYYSNRHRIPENDYYNLLTRNRPGETSPYATP